MRSGSLSSRVEHCPEPTRAKVSSILLSPSAARLSRVDRAAGMAAKLLRRYRRAFSHGDLPSPRLHRAGRRPGRRGRPGIRRFAGSCRDCTPGTRRRAGPGRSVRSVGQANRRAGFGPRWRPWGSSIPRRRSRTSGTRHGTEAPVGREHRIACILAYTSGPRIPTRAHSSAQAGRAYRRSWRLGIGHPVPRTWSLTTGAVARVRKRAPIQS